MSTEAYKITLTYEQIAALVKQLPKKDREKLSRELMQESAEEKLSRILRSFKTDEISYEEITGEVENVRAELYAKKKN